MSAHLSPEVELWTDGSGKTTGHPIGFAWALVHMPTGSVQHGRAGALYGTNNRAELLAVIYGLQALKRRTRVEVVTDSEYVGKAYTEGWIHAWKKKLWKGVKNPDLWKRLDALVAQHEVTWRFVLGHRGIKLNELCDFHAGEARRAIEAVKDSYEGLATLAFEVMDLPVTELQPRMAA